MLVFTRKRGQSIVIGDDIEIIVLNAGREGLRIGVRAPQHIPVHRQEIYGEIREENRAAGRVFAAPPAEAGEPSAETVATGRGR